MWINSECCCSSLCTNAKGLKNIKMEGWRERVVVIHQEITSVKGMWLHQLAGGDELQPGGSWDSG